MNSNKSIHSFEKLPRDLLTHPQYRSLSTGAIILYTHLSDRTKLSEMNNWRDSTGRIYVYCTITETQNILRCGHGKASKIMRELEDHQLIERTAQGQGRPHRIVVLPCDPNIKAANSQLSRNSQAGRLDCRNSAPNNTNLIRPINQCNIANIIRSGLDYHLLSDIPTQQLNAIINDLAGLICHPDDEFIVGMEIISYDRVCRQIWKLGAADIRYLYYQTQYGDVYPDQQCILEFLAKRMRASH